MYPATGVCSFYVYTKHAKGFADYGILVRTERNNSFCMLEPPCHPEMILRRYNYGLKEHDNNHAAGSYSVDLLCMLEPLCHPLQSVTGVAIG